MRRLIVIGLILLMAVPSAYTISSMKFASYLQKTDCQSVEPNGYTSHAPIYINGNSNFTAQNGVVGGNGTAGDPYIIEGWEIDSQGGDYCIKIENTNVYFVIRNCYLHGATGNWPYSGIFLKNVTNGRIENNTISGNKEGIFLYLSSHNIVVNNRCLNNNDEGIYIRESKYNVFWSNSMENCSVYIRGYLEDFTTQDIPTNNTVNGKPVYYYRSVNMNNSTAPTDAGEIILGDVKGLIIENLTISNGGVCVEIGYSFYIKIRNCTFKDSDLGVYIRYSDHNVVERNVFKNVSSGIILYGSSNNFIDSNALTDCTGGITVEYSSHYNILRNNSMNCTFSGIHIIFSTNNILWNNTMVGCGVLLWGYEDTYLNQEIPPNNTVNGKPLYYYKNIDMGGSQMPTDAGQIILANVTNLIIENVEINNTTIGLEIAYSSYIIVRNSTFSYNEIYGIEIYFSSNNLIYHNLLSHNSYYGLEITYGSYNVIYNNSFYYNHGSRDNYNSSCIQACDYGANNYWNSSSGIGNYWHDWANNNDTNDQNHDGIVDWSYRIDGSSGAKDFYPLKNPTVVVEMPKLSFVLPVLLGILAVLWKRRM